MRKSFRQLLLFASTVVFLAVAPLVVFYAMGYRLADDVNEASIGVLIVETVPRRARITVNGQPVGTSPQSIANLAPGEVDVSIVKDGFANWQKKVTIEPTAVTELRGIRLFPSTINSRALLAAVTQFSLAPNRQLIAALVRGAVHIVDEEGAAVIPPIRLPAGRQPQDLLWSPDSHSLLVIGDENVQLINSSLPAQARLLPRLAEARDLVWDPRLPDRLLALSPAGRLFAYQSASGELVTLAEKVATFATSSRHIFALQADRRELRVTNLQGQPLRTVTLPQPAEKLLITPDGQAALWYQDGALAVLGEADEIIPVAAYALAAGFSPDGQLLYVQTDESSVHVFNVSDERLRHLPWRQLHLIVRLSRPIRDPQWFAGGQHLIYQVEDEIVVTEIDTRDHPESRTIDSTNLGQSYPAVGRNGERVFYLKREGESLSLRAAAIGA